MVNGEKKLRAEGGRVGLGREIRTAGRGSMTIHFQ